MSKRILVVEDQLDNRQIIPICWPLPITRSLGGRMAGGTRGYRKAATRSHFDGYPIADHGRL